MHIIIIIIIIIIHTPKNLGAKKIERERDKEGQWTAGLFPVANRGLKGSWSVRQHTQITEEIKER